METLLVDPPVALTRLEDQIAFYSARSRRCKKSYVLTKLAQIVISTAIPLAAIFGGVHATNIAAVLGALLVVGEGMLQITRWHENWLTFRATSEALKHEKFLFLAEAGPYAAADKPLRYLAERVESLVSQENAAWVTTQQTKSEMKQAAQ